MSKPNEKQKIFTYSIVYEVPHEHEGEVSFCAHSKGEALELYHAWCKEDEHQDVSYPILSVESVHDPADAEFYGDAYGDPADAPMDQSNEEEFENEA